MEQYLLERIEQRSGTMKIWALFFLSVMALSGAEYRVAPGESLAAVVNKLKSGDVLTVLPGEYREAVSIKTDNVTIRAALPGTAIIRGDVDAPEFVKNEKNFWFCPWSEIPQGVHERDTLTTYTRYNSLNDLKFTRGGWFFDEENRRLYIATGDGEPPWKHYLTVSTIRDHGVYGEGQGIIIDGLTVTGFHSNSRLPQGAGAPTFYGVYLKEGNKCVVRNVTAFLNSSGIGISQNNTGNLIEDCRAYGNHPQFDNSSGNIIVRTPESNNIIRRCLVFDTVGAGIRYYGTRPAQNSVIEDCISFNSLHDDIWIKPPSDTDGVVRRSYASGGIRAGMVENSISTDKSKVYARTWTNTIVRQEEKNFSEDREFADPLHYDFRPQGDSKYRDRAPQPFSPSVYYVKPDGNDMADGNSVGGAFKSLDKGLTDDSTLYILPGEWRGNITLKKRSNIILRGRGAFPVTLRGRIELEDCRNIRIESIAADGFVINGGSGVSVNQCVGNLTAAKSGGLRVEHSNIGNLRVTDCDGAFISANLLKTAQINGGWSDYNAYENAKPSGELHSFVFKLEPGKNHTVKNSFALNGRAAGGMPVGLFRRQAAPEKPRVDDVRVLSFTATTANIEFNGNYPFRGNFTYGETKKCGTNIKLSEGAFHSVSLTGLTPGKEYYYRVASLCKVPQVFSNQEIPESGKEQRAITEIFKFTTLAQDGAPRTFHVAVSGDDASDGSSGKPWRTVSRAAETAVAGDTVLIGPGVYRENIQVRATGDAGRPLIFRGGPEVWIDGGNVLGNGIEINSKKWVTLDYLHFRNQNDACIALRQADDILLYRCLFDARSYPSPTAVEASFCGNLTVDNCVRIFGHIGMAISKCDNFTIRNSVLMVGGVSNISVDNRGGEKVLLHHNIITDNLQLKLPNALCHTLNPDALTEHDNGYFLRISPELKPMFLREKKVELTRPVFADPGMKALKSLTRFKDFEERYLKFRRNREPIEAPPDEFDISEPPCFADFFTTNPELIKRGIGLKPELFK